MYKKLIFLSILFIGIFIAVITPFKNERTPEDVVINMGLELREIAHVEYVSNGAFVFIDRVPKGLQCIYVKKNILGWKYDYDAAQGDLTAFFKRSGFSFLRFPKIKSVPFEMYYGVISDPNIQAVKVTYNDETQVSEAKIIENKNIRLWIAPVNNIEDGNVIIAGLSLEGKEISRVIEKGNNLEFQLYNNKN